MIRKARTVPQALAQAAKIAIPGSALALMLAKMSTSGQVLGVRGLGVGPAADGYDDKMLKLGPIAYWPLWEKLGTVAHCLVNPAQNATYNSDVSGWPVGLGIGDGNTAPRFDGVNDFVDAYTTTLRDAFNGSEGTWISWAQVSGVGVWTDAAIRYLARWQADGTNYVIPYKSNGANGIIFEYKAGAVGESQTTWGWNPTAWFCMAETWSKTGDVVNYYLNGAPSGVPDTVLGVWAGLLNIGTTMIGAANQVPASVWDGGLAHVLLFDRALTAGEIAESAIVRG